MATGIIIGIIIAIAIGLMLSNGILNSYTNPSQGNQSNSSSPPNPLTQPVSTISNWGSGSTTFPTTTIPNWVLFLLVIIVVWLVVKK